MRPYNVLPWLSCGKCIVGDIDPSMLAQHNRNPFDALAVLLADIEGATLEKQRIVQVFAPRAVVFHGQGDPAYLFRYGSPYGFASFALEAHGILTVLPRYNDPLNPKSGRRKSNMLLSGWQGVAEILESAVRHSSNWKNFQTIQTDAVRGELSWDDDRATYEIWATPRATRIVEWCEQPNKRHPDSHVTEGYVVMVQSDPVLLARATVREHVQDDGWLIEEVVQLELYPDFVGRVIGYDCGCDRGLVLEEQAPEVHNCNWRHNLYVPRCEPRVMLPIKVDMSHERVMRFQPHDELKLSLTWA